jgi:hypothetical protein
MLNADVPPSRADQDGHSGRHCVDEHMPGAVAVVVRPSGPAADGVTGHLRRGWIYADARRAGEELGAGWARAPGATIASEAPARATPPQAGHPSADAADDLLAVPASGVGDKAGGHRAVAAARPERAPRHALRPRARRCFRGLGRENCVTGSLADKPWCGVAGLLVGVGAETSQDHRSRRT